VQVVFTHKFSRSVSVNGKPLQRQDSKHYPDNTCAVFDGISAAYENLFVSRCTFCSLLMQVGEDDRDFQIGEWRTVGYHL